MLLKGLETLFPRFLRSGGIVFTLFSATVCNNIYLAKTSFVAVALRRRLDEAPPSSDALAVRALADAATQYMQHAGSLFALSAWGAVSTVWAMRDVHRFRGLTPLELERYCARMPFPMLRASSLGAFSVTAALGWVATGGLRFQPPAPGRPTAT